jgi:hypothetical protein
MRFMGAFWTFRFTDYLAVLQKPLTRERDLAAFERIRGQRKLHSNPLQPRRARPAQSRWPLLD